MRDYIFLKEIWFLTYVDWDVMIITKIIVIGIDVRDPIGLFSDPNNVLQIVARKYEGRCYMQCYILKVNRIIKTGECLINQFGDPSKATISVVCEVSALVFAPGEVVNGCEVKNQSEMGHTLCETEHACMVVKADPTFASIAQGQIVPLKVITARYNIGAEKVSITAEFFKLERNVVVHELIGVIDAPGQAIIDRILAKISAEEELAEQLKTQKKTAWETFNTMLYPFRAIVAPANTNTIHDMLKGKGTRYVSRDPKIYRTSPGLYIYSDVSAIPKEAIIRRESPPLGVIVDMLESYRAGLQMVREMVETYSTKELLDRHDNLWRIYGKMRQAA